MPINFRDDKVDFFMAKLAAALQQRLQGLKHSVKVQISLKKQNLTNKTCKVNKNIVILYR